MSSFLIRRMAVAATAAVAVSLSIVPAASAAPTPAQHVLSAGPLNNIWAGADLSCQVGTTNDARTEFFPAQADLGDCGTFLSQPENDLDGISIQGKLFGPDFGNHSAGSATGFANGSGDYIAYTETSQTPISGSGTAVSPYTVSTTVMATAAGLTFTITQTDRYIVGNDFYSSTATVSVQHGQLGGPFGDAHLFHAGDCFLRNSNSGFGARQSGGAACTLNANNSPASAFEQFVPVNPALTAYTETSRASLWPKVDSHSAPGVPAFNSNCDCTTNEDNAMGIEWDIPFMDTSSPPQSFSWQTAIYSPGPPASVSTGPAHPTSPTAAQLNGSASPNGTATTGHFIFGVDPSDRGPGFNGNVYDQSTPSQSLGSDFSSHSISLPISGLLPNTKYDVKFVASNSAGTTTGPNQTFTTPRVQVSAIPPFGSENFTPHGTVFVLFNNKFVKLTQTLQLPSGTEVDAINGSLTLVANSGAGGKASDARAKKPKKPQTFSGTFSGAVFKVIQKKFGRDRGLTTIQLVDRTPAFRGAPSYATTCRARGSADAGAARLSRRVIYTLRSRSRGRWGSRGRYAAGTVGGTVWTTTDRCDGTLVSVRIDKVLVSDLVRHIKILLHAGQHYLALAHPPKKHK